MAPTPTPGATVKALLIVQTRSGFIAVEPAELPAFTIDEVRAFESLGGRYSCGGVIDAVRDHFEPKPELREVA